MDRFLAGRRPEELEQSPCRRRRALLKPKPGVCIPVPVQVRATAAGHSRTTASGPVAWIPNPVRASTTASNGSNVVDFVSEDDVRRAIQKGEKIYINAKTIITPAARDIGEPAEIFVKSGQ